MTRRSRSAIVSPLGLLLLAAVAHAQPAPSPLAEYRVEGLADGRPYTASASIDPRQDPPALRYRRDDLGAFSLRLARRGERWTATTFLDARGLAGALDGKAPGGRVFQLELVPGEEPRALRARWRVLDPAGQPEASGSERWEQQAGDRTAPALLASSELFTAIVAAARRVAERGTVPAELMLTAGNRVDPTPTLDGPAGYAEAAAAIAGARHEVLLQTFLWRTDTETSRRLLAAVGALDDAPRPAGADPIRVRIVVNAMPPGGPRLVRELERAIAALDLDPSRVDARVAAHPHFMLGVLHSKSLVIDGRLASLPSSNVAAVHEGPRPWFDTAFTVEGDVVRALRADFAHLWRARTGQTLPPLPEAPPPVAETTPILVASRRPTGNPLRNGVEDPQGQALLTALARAQERVRIHTPNLNDDAVIEALARAAARGVEVQVVVGRDFNQSIERVVGGTNAASVRELRHTARRRGGEAALARLDVRWYADETGEVVEGNAPGAAHVKYASFDGQVAFVGSANMDRMSLNHSRELNLVVDGRALVASWDAAVFEPSFARAEPVAR